MTIKQLYSMLDLLSEHHRSKEDLMPIYVAERLQKSYAQYDKELQQSIQFLTRKHEKSILKRMAKIDSKSDR